MVKIKKNRHQPSTLNGHVHELLMRLFAISLVLLASGIVFYIFYKPVLAFLGSPLDAPLYYSSPGGGFMFVMKISLMGAIIVSIPVVSYNIMMFIRPAFSKLVSMKKIITTTILSTVLAITGAAFAFYYVVPKSLEFFAGYQVSGLNALISADSYLNFITGVISMFALIFQIPLAISFIDHIKPFNTGKMLKADKYVIVGSLILTLIQPFIYDLLTQLMIAGSIIAIYNLSIAIVAIQHLRYKSDVREAVMSSEFNIDEQLLSSFIPELAKLEGQQPPAPAPVAVRPRYVSMEFKRSAPQKVEPAAWVHSVKPQQQIVKPVIRQNRPVFSDFIRAPRINPVLASQ